MRRLRFLATIFVLLGAVGVAGHLAAYPYRTAVAVNELARVSDGLLVGDFSMPWPFKINKRALDSVAVALSNGTELKRYNTRGTLVHKSSGAGFLVARPEILFHLDGATQTVRDAELLVTVPVKIRDIFYKLPLGIAAFLFVVSWLGPGVRACLRPLQWRPLATSATLFAVMLAGLLGLTLAEGPGVWLALLALLLSPMIIASTLLQAEARSTGRSSRVTKPLIKCALLVGTVLGSCIVFEAYLGLRSEDIDARKPSSAAATEDWFMLPEKIVQLAGSRAGVLTLPHAWREQKETVEGASRAYTWHGALHLLDERGFRRLNGPFPAKEHETFRIMVVGDSQTYGVGIEEEWTYSRLLERSLQDGHRVEVINLGRSGYQSEDILGVLQKYLPLLDPDLVVYATCLNDFLPSGMEDYVSYVFPLPKEWKSFALERTHLARLFDDAYRSLLLAVGLSSDFFDDILAGEKGYQTRFARDVSAMNRFVREKGLPAMIGIVFYQFPGGDPRGWDLVEIAELALEDADFDLISVMSWRERFKDRVFKVSRWEGHPNELAHSLVAENLHHHISAGGYLDGFQNPSN